MPVGIVVRNHDSHFHALALLEGVITTEHPHLPSGRCSGISSMPSAGSLRRRTLSHVSLWSAAIDDRRLGSAGSGSPSKYPAKWAFRLVWILFPARRRTSWG